MAEAKGKHGLAHADKADVKRAKLAEAVPEEPENSDVVNVIVQFQTQEGEATGPQLEIPRNITVGQLQTLINDLLQNDEKRPYSFFFNEAEIVESLAATLVSQEASTETVLPIIYQPQAVFRVRAVTRCTSSLPGHAEAILHVSFSPDGKVLASGSGDATVRLWDVFSQTPKLTLSGHKNWVLAVAWSPNNKYIASGSMDKSLIVWNPEDGSIVAGPLVGHKQWITSIAWEPYHKNSECTRLATGSKDGSIRIWDVVRKQCVLTLGGHQTAVKAIAWGGEGLLYSASQDRKIIVWDAREGKLVRTLEGHAHWVNCLSLSTEYALRTGPYDHKGEAPEDKAEAMDKAVERYKAALASTGNRELLVSGSDDFTCYLWEPVTSKKPITRLVGHQQPVNFVKFSPDGRYIASASFDNSVRLWHGSSGKFVATLRGHVQSVYQVAWSADSRLLVSSSKDSTMVVWDMKTKKAKEHLPGHADEVYAVDWSPEGERVASGGKDKIVKMWSH